MPKLEPKLHVDSVPAAKQFDGTTFTKLLVELRITIYKLTASYDSSESNLGPRPFGECADQTLVHSVVEMLDKIIIHYRTTDYNRRKNATHYWDHERRRSVPRFKIRTPAILLLNKQIHDEAIEELRKTALVINDSVTKALSYHCLTLAHLIPLRSLNNIKPSTYRCSIQHY
jgi:hypothetical protein